MKKNIISTDEDIIDLSNLLKIIWDGKIKVILITVIITLLGNLYLNQTPVYFVSSIVLSSKDNTEFTKIKYVTDFLDDQYQKLDAQYKKNNTFIQNSVMSNSQSNLNRFFLNKFIEELLDYEELIEVLKNNKKILESVSGLPEKQKNKVLFKNMNLLEVKKINFDQSNNTENFDYIINFQWDNNNEVVDILENIIILTLENLKEFFYMQLMLELELAKKKILIGDSQRLEFLKEQSLIAQELKITENQIDTISLSESNVLFNINPSDVAYYLRGTKAIEKEISIIKNRKYDLFDNFEKEITDLKNSEISFINYNPNLISVKSFRKNNISKNLFIVIGLIIGLIFSVITNKFQFQTLLRKKK